MNIYALQERTIISHLRGLDQLSAARGLELRYYQFATARPVIAALVKLDFRRLLIELGRLAALLSLLPRLLFGPRALVVMGMAPFDIRMALLAPFLLRHTVYLHNSWPSWGPSDPTPKSRFLGISTAVWNAFVSHHVKGIFCVSRATAHSIGTHFPNWPPRAVVGHTIDAAWFADPACIEEKPWSRSVAFVGRMVAEKGVDDLLAVARTLPEFRFHFIGNGLMEQTVRDSAMSNVICHGYVGDRVALVGLLDECDIVVQPSRHSEGWVEAFGLGVLEGMARGLIPVTTDSPGSLEVLGPNLGFLTSPVADYQGHFLRTVAALDTGRARALRRRCAERARHFAPQAVTDRWETFLMETGALPVTESFRS